jgi:exonuclease III
MSPKPLCDKGGEGQEIDLDESLAVYKEDEEPVLELERGEQHQSRYVRCFKIWGMIVCSMIAVFIIVYLFAHGIGDEVHIAGKVENVNCKVGSAEASSFKVMTFNTFLIYCAAGLVKCQDEGKRKKRVQEMSNWFKDRNEDVLLFQEVWSLHLELKHAMADAGFCHFVMTNERFGSGLAIFSKFPIIEQDFRNWYDVFGIGNALTPEFTNKEALFADMGVLYAKIQKSNDTALHILNLHTSSDMDGDNHDLRMEQFSVTKQFLNSMEIPSTEMVLVGGNYNEDKDCRENVCAEQLPVCENQMHYKEMIDILSVDMLDNISNQTFTYDTTVNKLAFELYAGLDCSYQQLQLDYIFYNQEHLIPTNSSSCQTIVAQDPFGGDLSDHFPVSCTFHY